jgi:hypothetical protein
MQFGILRQRADQAQMADLSSALNDYEAAVGGITEKSSIGSVFATASPDSAEYAAAFRLLGWFWRSGLSEEFTARFHQAPVLLPLFCSIRRHTAGSRASHVNWHFDANFVGFGGSFLVFWVPLDPVGEESPGLDFYFPQGQFRMSDIAERWNRVPFVDGKRTLDDAGIAAFFGGPPGRRMHTVLNPGDLAVFDAVVPHRTQHLPSITHDRTAIEFRVTSAEAPIPNHVRFEPDVAMAMTGDGLAVTCLADLMAKPA